MKLGNKLIDWLDLWLGTLEYWLKRVFPCVALAFLLYLGIYVIETTIR